MSERRKIIAEIERRIARLDHRPGLCLYYAHQVASVLWQHHRRAVIQAGSLQWPRVRRDEDDGQINTHFSYMWAPRDRASQISAAIGNLPEMHVWVGIVDSQEVVDFSTRHIKQAALNLNLAWTAADPPRYLWARSMPDWVRYHLNRDASLLACAILKQQFNPDYLRR